MRKMDKFQQLVDLENRGGFIYQSGNARAVFAPDLGARVFCELNGLSLHRLDIENVRKPDRPFNNYGGNSFWPAPEGGKFGFNYKADQWYVQPAINNEPFTLESKADSTARAVKEVVLENRKGIKVKVVMQRLFAAAALPEMITDLKPAAGFAYTVDDSFNIAGSVKTDEALIACWTLEQFDSSDNTVSFVKVEKPEPAVNFDFYEHPGKLITYGTGGFCYKTNSKKRGQIGIKKDAAARCIGFYDFERKLLCVRQIAGQLRGLYFNIADNKQQQGPFSAADCYSIFNGDESLGFFELETIGGADVENEYLKGSALLSKTSFAIFDDTEAIKQFIHGITH